jgi:hypothetical protein
MTNLQKGEYYKLELNLFGRILNYEGEIAYLEKEEFGLKTKEESCPLQFRIKDITSIKQLPKPKQEEKVFKIYSKKKFKNLKQTKGPPINI